LLFSNCGKVPGEDMTVSGNVVVRNPYGYLPGNDYYKWPFYEILTAIYIFLALFWLLKCIKWFRELFSIHYCIGMVIIFGLVECFVWYIFYSEWNDTGIRPQMMFIF